MLEISSKNDIRFADVAHWMDKQALPFWASTGYDAGRRVCRERLALDGTVCDPGFRRIRALARQVYVYSHAEVLGWEGPAARIADTTLDYMTRFGWQGAEKGWARQLDDDGRVIDDTPDLYDHAFALFALGWRFLATNDPRHLTLADQTLDFILAHMRSADGLGYLEAVPAESDQRCQNPHMHLLEALIVLARTGHSPRYLQLATEIVDLYESRIVDAETGALREFFGPGWASLATPEGRITEPGHQFEWVWILNEYEKVGGRSVDDLVRKLFDFADRHGIDPVSGLTYDQVSDDGSLLKGSFRSWPQTETLKAHLAMGERSGKFDTDRIAGVVDNVFHHYLSRPAMGTWMDQLNTQRQGDSTFTPSTTLYHIFLAFAELRRLKPAIEAQLP
jgi:N-acylglucosamine 2-epimerase/mannose-6-phosphate isomerase